MELQEFFQILWRRRAIVLLTVVATTALSALFAFTRPTEYEATATVALSPANNEGIVSGEALNAVIGTYAQTAKSSSMRRRAEKETGTTLVGKVETATQAGTGILQIIGNAESAEAATQTAASVSNAFIRSLASNKIFEAAVVNPAVIPESPSAPHPPLIIGIGVLLGLLAGGMLAYGVDRLRGRIETTADVADITSAPILGVLPREHRLSRGPSRLIWEDFEMTNMQEGIRALRTNIELLAGGRRSVIQVTSPLASEGKSTIVANLGVALAQVGIETIVVDADLRRPSQHEIFHINNDLGVTNLLTGSVDMPVRRARTPYQMLTVLPSGPILPNSTEMLHVRAAALIEKLRETGAMILIDSPPLLPISDARLLASRADGVLLTIAAGNERPSTFRSAIETLQFAGASLQGIVLNHAVDPLSSSSYDQYRRQPQPPQRDPINASLQ
jgi:capsular exopolysaccharide synthesis family protein